MIRLRRRILGGPLGDVEVVPSAAGERLSDILSADDSYRSSQPLRLAFTKPCQLPAGLEIVGKQMLHVLHASRVESPPVEVFAPVG